MVQPEVFQVREQVILNFRDGRGARGVRAKTNLFGDVGKRALAIEASGFVRRWRVITGLR